MIEDISNCESLSSLPKLPIEVWEHVIDMVASPRGIVSSLDSVRRALCACRLVCRAWVPRCRLHLLKVLHIGSRDTLQSIASLLWTSPFHADQVRSLRIFGSSDQSWISIVPLCLPPLRHLESLDLSSVHFTLQNPRLPQVYSYFRFKSVERHLELEISDDQLSVSPAVITSLIVALRVVDLHTIKNHSYSVNTASDVALVNSWPHRLRSCMSLRTRGSLQDLLEILPAWACPAGKFWTITIQSTLHEGFTQLLPETRRLWKEIFRIFRLSPAKTPHINVLIEGLDVRIHGHSKLSSYRRAFVGLL